MAPAIAKWITSGTLLVVGVIHLLPISGVVGSTRLQQLYGIAVNDPNLEILLRHRAVLFGLLGAFLVYAAFRPATQPIAFAAGFISVLTFFWLAYSVGNFNVAIGRVVSADVVALTCLVIGALSWLIQARN